MIKISNTILLLILLSILEMVVTTDINNIIAFD